MCKKFLKCRKNKRNNQPGKRVKFLSTHALCVLMLVLIVMGGIYNLGLINQKATLGYRMADLEKQIANLQETNQALELEAIELQQITNIQERAQTMQMVIADEVDYLSTGGSGLAVR